MVVEAEKIKLDIKELEAKIQDGERRLDALHAEAKAQLSPFTVTSDPQEEIRQLRLRIAQMEASQGGGCIQEEIPSKRPKTLAVSSLDLVPLGDGRLRGGALMSNLIDQADVSTRR